MSRYIIEGGFPLHGEVEVYGAKNAAFKMMIAALLSDGISRLTNVSYVRDAMVVKQIIESLGGKAFLPGSHTVEISGAGLSHDRVEAKYGASSRAATLLIPVLLHRFKKATVPLPGGDQIGQRPIDRHLEALRALGVKVEIVNNEIQASAAKLVGAEHEFPKNTHTGTEMMLLAACLAEGRSVIKNAAAEPEVDNLIEFLNKMGAQIKRVEPRTIEVFGVSFLKGAEHEVIFDRNEAVTFACAALGTKGDCLVKRARKDLLEAFLTKVDEANGGWEEKEEGIRFFSKGPLKPTMVQTAPFPGFMTDWQALWVTLMTQAEGESVLHETVFENRFVYVDQLREMGAKIELFSPEVVNPEVFYNFNWSDESAGYPHAAKIDGPTQLSARHVEVADIRAGATLTVAALMADGQSSLLGVELIERGYENLEGRLAGLGAKTVKDNS